MFNTPLLIIINISIGFIDSNYSKNPQKGNSMFFGFWGIMICRATKNAQRRIFLKFFRKIPCQIAGIGVYTIGNENKEVISV